MSELRDALLIFDFAVRQKTSLGKMEHLQLLCDGYAAAAQGWRMLAEGFDQDPDALRKLQHVVDQLTLHAVGRRGPKTKWPDAADDLVLRRYYERDPLSLPLRHFVETAFDAGELDPEKRHTIDVHVNRLQRYLDKRT